MTGQYYSSIKYCTRTLKYINLGWLLNFIKKISLRRLKNFLMQLNKIKYKQCNQTIYCKLLEEI